jgi:ATP-binding cassette subfamily B protein
VGALLSRTLACWAPYPLHAAVVVLALLVETVFWAVYPLGVRGLIDNALGQRTDVLWSILGGLACFFLVTALLGLAQDRVLAHVGAKLLNNLRQTMFAHLQSLSSDYFQRTALGDILARFTADVNAVEIAATRALPRTVLNLVSIIVSVGVLYYLNWELALCATVALPLAVVGPRVLGRSSAEATYGVKQAEGRGVAFMQEAVSGQAVVRAYGLEEVMRARLAAHLATLDAAVRRDGLLSRLVQRTTTVGVTFGQLLVIGIGSILVNQGSMTVGALVGFIGVLLSMGSSVNILSYSIPDWLQAAGALRHLDDLLHERPAVQDAPGATRLPPLHRDIRLHGVTFAYSDGKPVLQDLSISIGAGQSVALVGPSGSGKSSVLNVIQRLADPVSGVVEIDGVDIRGVTQSSVREQMGVVFQESFLFSGTVQDNIRMGRPGASEDDVVAAARAAQVHDVILGLPDGYLTDVGERGSRLSGGQRQRVALARALVRNPSVLLLDEATSALDPGSEMAFNATLAALAGGRTIISVTHRLSSATSAGTVFVLDQGRVVEHGSHADLLERRGLYQRLWDQQQGFTISEDGSSAAISVNRLKSIPLFNTVSESVLATVAPQFVSERYEPDQEVIVEGHRGDKFYVVVRGRLRVSQHRSGGGTALLGRLADGDFFGEIALLSDVPRTASVRAEVPSVLLSLTRQHFQALMRVSHELRLAVERAAAERFGVAHGGAAEKSALDTKQRLP